MVFFLAPAFHVAFSIGELQAAAADRIGATGAHLDVAQCVPSGRIHPPCYSRLTGAIIR